MPNTCDICKHVDSPDLQVFATDGWVVNLAPDQGYVGRCYITLRAHRGSLSDLSEQEWAEYASIVTKLERACKQAFGAEPFNWSCLMNNAYQVEPSEPHVHWHFRPRHKRPITLNGQTFTDADYGHHYDREHRVRVDSETLAAIKKMIQTNLV
jgi:diadenosine tetraphosphate (Ap4A) HIT family hydrolase